jgi:hypothetical protein
MTTVSAPQDNPTVLKLINPIVKTILRSPLHHLLSRHFMLITFTGRKTGKRYTTPTASLRDQEMIYLATGTRWWKNLQGGAPVSLVVAGKRLQGDAEVIVDPLEVAQYLHWFIGKVGTKKAFLMGLKIDGEQLPTLEEVKAGVRDSRVIVRIKPKTAGLQKETATEFDSASLPDKTYYSSFLHGR